LLKSSFTLLILMLSSTGLYASEVSPQQIHNSSYFSEQDRIQKSINIIKKRTELSNAKREYNDAIYSEGGKAKKHRPHIVKKDIAPYMSVDSIYNFHGWEAKVGTKSGDLTIREGSRIFGVGVVKRIDQNGITVKINGSKQTIIYGLNTGVMSIPVTKDTNVSDKKSDSKIKNK